MPLSVFDLYSVGVGPSSSHTVGPMRAAARFAGSIVERHDVSRIRVELLGSLGATGHGHGSVAAVLAGLQGDEPETVDLHGLPGLVEAIQGSGRLRLSGERWIDFDPLTDITLDGRRSLPAHPNGMSFFGLDSSGKHSTSRDYYSVGGGFVLDQDEMNASPDADTPSDIPFPFSTAAELLGACGSTGLAISEVMLANELAGRTAAEIDVGLATIWQAMRDCVARGCATEGQLPGGLGVQRRAPALFRSLQADPHGLDALHGMEWVNAWAMAVNEENAAGGRIVTAPTNGAAGIVPAVLHYYTKFVPGSNDSGVKTFLLTSAAIGMLIKQNASISGAELGCQAEVGAACAMAAAGLCEALGGTPAQVENAAEIALEHNLGLTCDPVGGLVQIPCIERNAIASVKAINASRIAMRGDGTHLVSLDDVIRTLKQTGDDMHTKYKETSTGGLAVNVIEC